MGMAASQARFLGLTARKNNTEYSAQQINQARTALSTQSANLFNQMLTLNVPTPPDITQFYNTSYTFEDGDTYYEITSGLGSETATLTKTTEKTTVHSQEVNNGKEVQITRDGNKAYLQGKELTQLTGDNNSAVSTAKLKTILEDGVQLDESAPFVVSKTAEDGTITKKDILNNEEYQAALLEGYDFDKTSENNVLWSYMKNGTAYFIQGKYVPENNITEIIPQEFYDFSNKVFDKTITMTDCSWDKDSSGRYSSVSGYLGGNSKYITYDLKYNSEEDEDAYDQAMIEYNYKNAQYEKEIADINAKTEAIQQEDRGLELQLRQLDTEQKALSTELEAVKKVIEDNVERVFKTFA